MESLFHDGEHYKRCLQSYSDLCDSYEPWIQWLDLVFSDIVMDQVGGVLHLTKGTADDQSAMQTFKILGIGCGSGIKHYDLIKRWATKYSQISTTVLEPLDIINDYKKLVSARDIVGVEWDWQQKTWEQFDESMNIQRSGEPIKFHFISAIAVLYYLKDWQDAVLGMYGRLEKGGILLITLNADDCACAKLWTKFPMLSGDVNNQVNANQVEGFLKKKKIDYDVIKHIDYVNITTCFEYDTDPKADLVLDFIAHIKNFRKGAPSNLVASVLEYLKGPECSLVDGKGQIMLNESLEAIVIQKK